MARHIPHLLTRGGLLGLAGLALAVPGTPSEALAGLPLSVAGVVCAAGLLYAALALPSPGWRVGRWLGLGLALVIGLKLAAAGTSPPVGLQASFWAKPSPEGPAERSTDFPWLANATRIDPALDLRGEDFAAHFFNDAARFNFGPDVQPARDQLPFVVQWQGFFQAASDGERRFLIEANGPASVWIDETALAGTDTRLAISAGLHALRVDYARLEARVPRFRLTWQRQPGGALETLGGADVRWQADARGAELGSALGRIADFGLLACVVGWVAVGLLAARRSNRLITASLGLVPLVFLLHGTLLQAPLAGRATILSGLDDWLIYESSARDILLNGPLMDGGQGHAPPFYGQPLYPYVLALAHRLTGESLFGPLALQFAALGGVLAGAAVLARRAFGSQLDGLVALACMWLLVELEAEHFKVARQLFNENLYMPLVLASLIVVVGLARRPQPPVCWRAVLVGMLLGATAISRSQFLVWVPFGLLILLVGWRRDLRHALLKAFAIVAGLLLVVAPVTARNWAVSGQFVPITSGGGASLLEFHRPPPGLLDPAALQSDPLFNALHLDTQTRTVVAFARTDPGGYLATLLPLGAHSIGLQGRNDPGIYWPLLLTTLLYAVSFALRRTRRLHVWPIHAFVGTHLLVLMLFEADTYGYRLVIPMYAPMVVVAAQVPLALIRGLIRSPGGALSSGNPRRAARYAALGWSALIAGALLWQVRGLADSWPQRETALHGLGGTAAQAALTADRVGADAIYVASIDGTPRRFGAGSLTGLRYPWFKWFDPSRSLPLPPQSGTAVYMLSELNGHSLPGDLVACLGPPDADGQRVLAGDQARQQCVGTLLADSAIGVTFDGVARFEALGLPDSVAAGEVIDSRLVWQPLAAEPEAQQVSLQLDDPSAGDGTLWGNGTLELYPSRQWEPGEEVLSRIPVATDATAIPQQYRLTLGIGPTRPNAPPATASWQGQRTDRVPVAPVTLTPGSSAIGQALPADMRAPEGPKMIGGGLELIGARPLPSDAAIGSPLRVGLLWRAMQDEPSATQITLRLVRDNGEIVQESVLPLLGGRLLPSALRAGNVVRDEETLVVGARVPSESLAVELNVLDARVRLGSVRMTGRAHVFDASVDAVPEAAFGQAMQLLSDQVDSRDARTVSIKLRWRDAAEMKQAYKVFVHVLDQSGARVVAQRDAEPLDGAAPTTGWVTGEVIDDQYAIPLPAGLSAGDYPIEVGVYDPRSGDRLLLPNGDSRVVLNARLHVR